MAEVRVRSVNGLETPVSPAALRVERQRKKQSDLQLRLDRAVRDFRKKVWSRIKDGAEDGTFFGIRHCHLPYIDAACTKKLVEQVHEFADELRALGWEVVLHWTGTQVDFCWSEKTVDSGTPGTSV